MPAEPAGRHPLSLLLRPTWDATIVEAGEEAEATGPRVVCRAGAGAPVWLAASDWRVLARPDRSLAPAGETIATFAVDGDGPVDARHAGDEVAVPFSLAEAYDAFVAERWRQATTPRGLSERQLALFYLVKRAIPRQTQLAARRALIRRQGVPSFPAWPLDTSASKLLAFFAACALHAAGRRTGEFVWFWPNGYRAAFVLTHDVESAEGIRLALHLADLEQEHGFRSSFNFGAWYDVDPGVLHELRSRGFEVGMHGLVHDRTLFSSRETFDASLRPLAELARRLGAVGFRSPATHRVFDWLADLPVDYDCTIPNSDPYEPQPGGCCSVWPFFVGRVVELPYTLPQDHTLLTLLGHRSPHLWLEQAARLEAEYGLIQCVSHPDRGYLADPDKRAIYAEFLQGMGERAGVWRALPREVASWWTRRADAGTGDDAVRLGTASLGGEPGRAQLAPPPP